MKSFRHNSVMRWLEMLVASFLMYEALWSVIQMQFESLAFDAEETLWDFAQCVMFTSVVFCVDWCFMRFRGGRYARSLVEVGCLLAASSLLIYLVDNIIYVQETGEDNFWNVIDVYVICIICVLLSIIDLQHSYHCQFIAMKQEQLRWRLNLLQQQLSPHFMFNSLSTLQGLIAVNPQRAEEYVSILSGILRYITQNIGKEKVPLPDAIDFIKSYARMLDVRFPGHFALNIDTTNMPHGASIVPVSLQIAVENAIKHSRHSQKMPLKISIAFAGDAVEISNKKQSAQFAGGLSVGLENLSERYKLLTDKALEIYETQDSYTVKIPLMFSCSGRASYYGSRPTFLTTSKPHDLKTSKTLK